MSLFVMCFYNLVNIVLLWVLWLIFSSTAARAPTVAGRSLLHPFEGWCGLDMWFEYNMVILSGCVLFSSKDSLKDEQ